MLRMVTSDFRRTPMANFGMSYFPRHWLSPRNSKPFMGPVSLATMGALTVKEKLSSYLGTNRLKETSRPFLV